MRRGELSTMIHTDFDLEFFTRLFPLDRLRADAPDELMQPGGERVTSPYHIAVVEQLRAELLVGIDAPASVPVDVFVWAEGEPKNRATTKVGGLPYWPKSKPWPANGEGDALTFVAQLCFADSLDIVPSVPGDLLLVFGDQECLWDGREDEALRFHWLSMSNDDLVGEGELPATEWQIARRYGARHRTVDYASRLPGVDRYSSPYLISAIEGTKIGGIPRWIQSVPELPGRFIASLGSIQSESGYPFPYLNHPEPVEMFQFDEELMWDDVGSTYLTVTRDGSIHYEIQSY
jgi:hypothetical protein